MKRGGPEHPKIAKLAAILNINRAWAVGIVEMLWHFTAKFAPQGDIGKYSDSAIAEAVAWDKHPGLTRVPPEFMPSSGRVTTELWLSSALVRAGFLDSCSVHRLVVHDWKTHCDEAVRKKLSRQRLDFVQTVSRLPEPLPEPSHIYQYTTSSSESSVRNGTAAADDDDAARTDLEKTARTIRAFYPSTGPEFIERLGILATQAAAGVEVQKLELTDDLLADAVRECRQEHGDNQRSAGLFLTTVPRLIASWVRDGRTEATPPPKKPVARSKHDQMVDQVVAEMKAERLAKEAAK